MRRKKSARPRKKHAFKKPKNANGKNDTKPIKYDAKYVLGEVTWMLEELYKDGKLGGHPEIFYKTQLIVKRGEYSEQRFSEWIEKFAKDEKISEAIQRIDDIFRARAWVGGLQGNLNSTICKFHLINNHGAKEVEKVELSGRVENVQQIRKIIKRSDEI